MITIAVDILGEINASMADDIVSALNRKADRLIGLVDSHGGDTESMWRIFHAIRRHPATKKSALGMGQVSSAAILPFAAFDVRSVLSDTAILMHGEAIGPEQLPHRLSASALSRVTKKISDRDERVTRELSHRCDCDEQIWRAEQESEHAMPLLKALSIGLVHEIVGQSPAPSAKWADQVEAGLRKRAFDPRMSGFGGYLFKPSFLRACRLAHP